MSFALVEMSFTPSRKIGTKRQTKNCLLFQIVDKLPICAKKRVVSSLSFSKFGLSSLCLLMQALNMFIQKICI